MHYARGEIYDVLSRHENFHLAAYCDARASAKSDASHQLYKNTLNVLLLSLYAMSDDHVC